MGRLERFRGHFYNWYETTDLRPLEPRYVSTVDSGNLASQLLVLGNACRGALECPLLDHEAFAGIEDAVLLVREAASVLVDDRRTQTVGRGHLDQACEALVMMLRDPPRTAADWVGRLGQLAGQADALVDIARTLTAERGDGEDSEVLVWALATRATIASHRRDLERLMPWASRLEAVVAGLPPASREAVSASSALCSSFPTLAALADLCESAVSELTAMLDGGPRAGSVRGDRVEHVHELIGQLEGAAVASRDLVERLSAAARVTRQLFDAMEFGFLFHLCPQGLRDRLSRHGGESRSERIRSPRLRSAACELHRDCQRRGPHRALVPPGSSDDARWARGGSGVLVRLDVRVPDAGARHAVSAGKLAPADVSPRRPASDWVRYGARDSLGHLRIGVQRARPRPDLPVLELRGSGSGSRAGPQRGLGRRALRDRPGRHDRPGCRRPQLHAPHRGGREGSLRIL